MAKGKKRTDLREGISFGDQIAGVSIAAALGKTPPAEAKQKKTDASEAKAQDASTIFAKAERAVISRESAGRGGKPVTIVELRPPMNEQIAEAAAKTMRKALGCGSRTEQRSAGVGIVLQGDMRERAKAQLEKAGAKKITIGN